jgi:hypothetical protein
MLLFLAAMEIFLLLPVKCFWKKKNAMAMFY